MRVKPIRLAVFAAYLFQIVFNAVGSGALGDGPTVGDLSDKYATAIVPADYAFSIWGVIFLGTLAYSIYQLWPHTHNVALYDRLAIPAIGVFVFCGLWIPFFVAERIVASVIIMVALLALLVVVFVMIMDEERRRGLNSAETFTTKIPFSIFLGWITVATVANFAQWGEVVDWNGFGIAPNVWSVIMLLVAGTVASFVTYVGRGNIGYALTLVWALVAVAVNHVDAAGVSPTAIVVALIIASMIVVGRRQPSARLLRTGLQT